MARAKRRISEEELQKIREIPLTDALDRCGIYWKFDMDFHPLKDKSSKRINVNIGPDSWEIIFTGMRWMDTRTETGGGGSIDLLMYLLKIDFLDAVKKLVQR